MFNVGKLSWGHASYPKCAASNRQSESSGIRLLTRVSKETEDSLPTEEASVSVVCDEATVSRSEGLGLEYLASAGGACSFSIGEDEAMLEIFGKVRMTWGIVHPSMGPFYTPGKIRITPPDYSSTSL